jgi:uncharacterized repeat protein (TIGR01451 family)
VIQNQATVTWTEGAFTGYFKASNIDAFNVDELLDVSVISLDAANVYVAPGESARTLTYLLNNAGNGMDAYALAFNNAIIGDQFDPASTFIYIDADGDGFLDTNVDDLYVPGVNDPLLAGGQSVVVFVLSNIPSAVSFGDLGIVGLNASSLTNTAAPGTVIPGGGDSGTHLVVGSSGGASVAQGVYEVFVDLKIVKTATVVDLYGGARPSSGAEVTYTIRVSLTGSSTALGVVITDPIPPYTQYKPGSLTLNGVSQSPALDGDAGDVGGTTPGEVTVTLGDMVSGAPDQIIAFTVIID